MTDYTKTAQRADQSLRRKGGLVTLRRSVPGTYNTTTLKYGAPTVTDYVGYGAKVSYDAKHIDGTLIQHGDRQLLLSPLQTDGTAMPTPKVSDTIVIGSATYTVKHVAAEQPTDTAVLFTLQIRGL